MNLVSSQTSIPIPKVRRQLVCRDNILEYIERNDLEKVWQSLTDWQRVKVAAKLHNYVEQWRRVKAGPIHLIPGPVGGSGILQKCEVHYFTEICASPFSKCRRGSLRITVELERRLSTDLTPPRVFLLMNLSH
jgi:hypothetical protein